MVEKELCFPLQIISKDKEECVEIIKKNIIIKEELFLEQFYVKSHKLRCRMELFEGSVSYEAEIKIQHPIYKDASMEIGKKLSAEEYHGFMMQPITAKHQKIRLVLDYTKTYEIILDMFLNNNNEVYFCKLEYETKDPNYEFDLNIIPKFIRDKIFWNFETSSITSKKLSDIFYATTLYNELEKNNAI